MFVVYSQAGPLFHGVLLTLCQVFLVSCLFLKSLTVSRRDIFVQAPPFKCIFFFHKYSWYEHIWVHKVITAASHCFQSSLTRIGADWKSQFSLYWSKTPNCGRHFVWILSVNTVNILQTDLTSRVHLLKCRTSFSCSCTCRRRAASTRWRSWCTTIPRCPTASSPRCTTRRRSATSPPSTESLPTTISGRWNAPTSPWSTSWEGASTGRCTRGFGRSTTSPWLSRR